MKHSPDFIHLCSEAQKHVTEVSVEQAQQLLRDGSIDYLIDVRDQDEFEQGHIEAALHLSKGWIEAKIHHHVPSKESTILLYCGGGNRSLLAAYNLQKMGYANVLSLCGGYKGWQDYGQA